MNALHDAPARQVAGDEPRYDPQTVRKAVELATKLQLDRESKVTVSQLESIADQLGIEVDLLRQALDHVTTVEKSPTSRFISADSTGRLVPMVAPMIGGLLIMLLQVREGGPNPHTAILLSPLLLSVGIGFCSGTKMRAVASSVATVFCGAIGACLALAMSRTLSPHQDFASGVLPYVFFCAPAAAALGGLGAKLRQRFLRPQI